MFKSRTSNRGTSACSRRVPAHIPEGLLVDLPIWSSGLFPFFEYAATSVKPTLLNLFDTHYLPLQSGLRPVMKSFILALLPGLEEETSEFFDKVLNLLDRLSGTVSPSFFFQNIWLVMLTTPTARGTSLNYLARRLPRLNADEDITQVVGKDIGLMIRAFAAALEDENLLVRRGALDLLLQSLRADSTAVRKAQVEDRVILMRAASGVVLRRDLSLNRRLYTWLLGPDEKSEHQTEYLKTYGLDLVYSTLKNEMFSPSGEYAESRPFKIFISLLDKWEIGAALSHVLVYDAFKAIKNLIDNPSDGGEDVTMTASTLYEAVEPHILWKQLLTVVFAEVTGDRKDIEAIRMAQFLLKTFSQDDEIQTIHFPIIFAAVLDLIDVQVQGDVSRVSSPMIKEALLLQEEMLQHIPHSALMQRPDMTGPIEAKRTTQRPYLFACSFYGVDPINIPASTSDSFAVPFVSAFESLTTITRCCAQALTTSSSDITVLREVFSLSLSLLNSISSRLTALVTLAWNPDEWLQAILRELEHELLDQNVRRILSTAKVNGREIQVFLYEYPFDQRYMNHLLDLLLSIIRFGGQGFAKTAKATPIRRSHHTGLVQRVEASE
ncbi:hypothetical protein C0993_005728 [Termitomyces sp. T159_Od127]|nr:hypothetical protein C0993_005728 [Termitomyces sp. T159_Od127]